MNKILVFSLTLLYINLFFGQVKFQKSPYESMYNSDQIKIHKLWKEYLESINNKSSGDCSLWENSNNTFGNNCNLLISQGFFNPSLFNLGFTNQILSILRVDESTYNIFSIFYNNNNTFEPFAITNVLAKRQKANFLLKDYLSFSTKEWKIRKVGRIIYHFPKDYNFNISNAKKANVTLNNIDNLFDIGSGNYIHYFIASNCNDVTSIVGFEYIPTQNSLLKNCAFYDEINSIIYTTRENGENHKHELIHRINIKYPNAHYLLTTGLSIYSSQRNVHIGFDFGELFKRFVNFYSNNNESPSLFKQSNIGDNIVTEYLVGAILIDAILETGNIEGLREALNNLRSKDDIYNYLRTNFNVNENSEGNWLLERAKKLANENYKFKIVL